MSCWCCSSTLQWRIYIVKFWTCTPPRGPNSFNFMQFLEKVGKIVCWRPPPGELVPPPLGNPGSATALVSYTKCGRVAGSSPFTETTNFFTTEFSENFQGKLKWQWTWFSRFSNDQLSFS